MKKALREPSSQGLDIFVAVAGFKPTAYPIKLAAELPKTFRIFHELRHHYAVTRANSGKVTLDMIGELLTHKSAAMTKHYGQLLPGTIKDAGNLAAELIQAAAQVQATPMITRQQPTGHEHNGQYYISAIGIF